MLQRSIDSTQLTPSGTARRKVTKGLRMSPNHARRLLATASLLLLMPLTARGACQAIAIGDPRWKAIDQQYATIERATFAKDPKLLFSVYAPDFEAHQFNGQVWKFSDSAAYSTAGLKVVKENISL